MATPAFFKLPAELRIQIYEISLCERTVVVPATFQQRSKIAENMHIFSSNLHKLLNVCKAMRSECLPILIKRSTFRITTPEGTAFLHSWLNGLENGFSSVRALEFYHFSSSKSNIRAFCLEDSATKLITSCSSLEKVRLNLSGYRLSVIFPTAPHIGKPAGPDAVEAIVKFYNLRLLLEMRKLKQITLVANYYHFSGRDIELKLGGYAFGLRAVKNWFMEEFNARREPGDEVEVLAAAISGHEGHRVCYLDDG